jgi:hypothetical protein
MLLFVLLATRLCDMELIWQRIFNLKLQSNKATNEHINRAAQILAKREKESIDDPAEVIALCKQVVAVPTRELVHL